MSISQTKNGRAPRSELSGVDKVTALLLVMGKPHADRIIKQFADGQIRALARAAVALPPIGIAEIDQLVGELAKELEGSGAIEGSSNGVRSLLSGVMPEEEVGEIMGEIAGRPPTLIWRKLGGLAEDKLVSFVSTEQPQVAAQVLSKLEPEKASAILAKLEPELRVNLSKRLVTMKPIGEAAAKLLAQRLGTELLTAPETAEPNNHALLGKILNQLDRQQTKSVLERLEAEVPEDARKVRKYVFSFEDVTRLTNEDRARLFEEASTDRVVLSLRECDPTLLASIISSLSPRAKRLIESELAIPVKVPNKAIEDARRAIADLALVLAERSVIVLEPAEQEQSGN